MADADKPWEPEIQWLKNELGDIKIALFGPRGTPYYGLQDRLKTAEDLLGTVKKQQDDFIRDKEQELDRQDKEQKKQTAKQDRRNKIYIAAITAVFGLIVSTFLIVLRVALGMP